MDAVFSQPGTCSSTVSPGEKSDTRFLPTTSSFDQPKMFSAPGLKVSMRPSMSQVMTEMSVALAMFSRPYVRRAPLFFGSLCSPGSARMLAAPTTSRRAVTRNARSALSTMIASDFMR